MEQGFHLLTDFDSVDNPREWKWGGWMRSLDPDKLGDYSMGGEPLASGSKFHD